MTSIQEILGKFSFTKNDLLDKCRELGIHGYSGLNKQALILKIEQFNINDGFTPDEELPILQVSDNILESLNTININNTPNTKDAETQVNSSDFTKNNDNASIHYQVIDKVKLEKTKSPGKLLLKTINGDIKFKIGDIVLNEIGIAKYNNEEIINIDCLDIICRDGNKKKLINFNTITEELQDKSYLKNINYDNVILDMDSKFKVDKFKSPIIDLCIFYAKMNEKHHLLETIYEFNDPPYPVLSNNEVIHDPYCYYN